MTFFALSSILVKELYGLGLSPVGVQLYLILRSLKAAGWELVVRPQQFCREWGFSKTAYYRARDELVTLGLAKATVRGLIPCSLNGECLTERNVLKFPKNGKSGSKNETTSLKNGTPSPKNGANTHPKPNASGLSGNAPDHYISYLDQENKSLSEREAVDFLQQPEFVTWLAKAWGREVPVVKQYLRRCATDRKRYQEALALWQDWQVQAQLPLTWRGHPNRDEWIAQIESVGWAAFISRGAPEERAERTRFVQSYLEVS